MGSYTKNNIQKIILAVLGVVFVGTVLFAPFFGENTAAAADVSDTERLAFGDGDDSKKEADVWDKAAQYIGNFLFTVVSAVVLFPGGLLLNGAIDYTIVNLAEKVPTETIDAVWIVVRDVCNLAFIFGFIYIGFRSIFQSDNAQIKRFLARIIIGALLINFSLFFGKVVVDLGNFLAVAVYNTGMQGYLGVENGNLTERVVDALQLSTLRGDVTDSTLGELGGGKVLFYYLMATLTTVFVGFVFLVAGAMLIIRFVTIIFILIASPILFAAIVFPQTERYASMLWKKLIANSVYPAIFLFFIFISLRVIEEFKSKLFDGAFSQNYSETFQLGSIDRETVASITDILLLFAVAIFLMSLSLSIAKSISVTGGDFAANRMNAFRRGSQRVFGGMVGGGAAKLGRTTFGRLAYDISEREGLKDTARARGLRGMAARGLITATRGVGDSSFDVRKVGGVGKALDIGEGRKGGFKSAKEEEEKKREEFAKSLGTLDDTDIQVKGRKTEMEKAEEDLRHLKESKKLEEEKEKKERDANDAKISDAEKQITNLQNEIVSNDTQTKEFEKTITDLKKQIAQAEAAGDYEKKQELENEFKELNKQLSDLRMRAPEIQREIVAKEKELVELEKAKVEMHEKHLNKQNERADGIAKQEKLISEKKRLYEQEKMRRQIGSTYIDVPKNKQEEYEALKDEIEREKTGKRQIVKEAWKAYAKLTDDKARKAEFENLRKLEKELKDAEEKLTTFLTNNTDRGYAGVLESSNILNTWPLLRSVRYQNDSGKAIRRTREKGLPKVKEDKSGSGDGESKE